MSFCTNQFTTFPPAATVSQWLDPRRHQCTGAHNEPVDDDVAADEEGVANRLLFKPTPRGGGPEPPPPAVTHTTGSGVSPPSTPGGGGPRGISLVPAGGGGRFNLKKSLGADERHRVTVLRAVEQTHHQSAGGGGMAGEHSEPL